MVIFWTLLLLLAFGFPITLHAAGELLAEVDGVAITSEEVEKSLASQLSKLEEQIYNLKRQRVEALINEKLLAKEAAKRGVSVPAQLESEYGEKIKLGFRDFPIDNLHPEASKAHEAARCANEQGKFWAYHDKLFAGPPKSSPEIFKGFAKDLGLNVTAFESCFASG